MANEQVNWNEYKIGALWYRNDEVSFSGVITGQDGRERRVFAFPNRYKDKENDPDYKIYLNPSKQTVRKTPAKKTKPKQQPKVEENDGGDEEEDNIELI